jgi:hypothetical protein
MLHIRTITNDRHEVRIAATDDTSGQRFRIVLKLDKLRSNCGRAERSPRKTSIGGAVTVTHVGEEHPTVSVGRTPGAGIQNEE